MTGKSQSVVLLVTCVDQILDVLSGVLKPFPVDMLIFGQLREFNYIQLPAICTFHWLHRISCNESPADIRQIMEAVGSLSRVTA